MAAAAGGLFLAQCSAGGCDIGPHNLFRFHRQGRLLGLTPYLHESLHRGQRNENQHDPQNADQEARKDQADGQCDDPLGPFHQAAFGRETVDFSLGSLIGDQGGRSQHGEAEHGDPAAMALLEVPGDAAEEKSIGHAVSYRVEECAADARRIRGLGHGPIEQIRQGRGEEQHESPAGVS